MQPIVYIDLMRLTIVSLIMAVYDIIRSQAKFEVLGPLCRLIIIYCRNIYEHVLVMNSRDNKHSDRRLFEITLICSMCISEMNI